jgi:hypothetical protein
MPRFIIFLLAILPFIGFTTTGDPASHEKTSTITVYVTSADAAREVEVTIDYVPSGENSDAKVISVTTPYRFVIPTNDIYAIVRNNSNGTAFSVRAVKTGKDGNEQGSLDAKGNSVIAFNFYTTPESGEMGHHVISR